MFLSARDEFGTRQADTLANAWAVLEQSIASLKSPAEVSGPRERRSGGNETQINSSSVNGNALVDGASVPVVYPPNELGKQGIPYELGGPGIPTMIPGGMPSGVPWSGYRTTVDAMNQQFVNRYCSPELFLPMDSAYYTVPNTCLQVRNPNWSTEATPGNSQSQNEVTLCQEMTEADSGLGRTGSGHSLRNSRSQREELRDEQASTSRPTPKSTETGRKRRSCMRNLRMIREYFYLAHRLIQMKSQLKMRKKLVQKSEQRDSKNEKSAKRKSVTRQRNLASQAVKT